MPSSHRITDTGILLSGTALASVAAQLAFGPAAIAANEEPGGVSEVQERNIRIAPPTSTNAATTDRINPTGKAIVLGIPAKDGNSYLGDVILTINPDDSIQFSARRILDLLTNVLEPNTLKALQGSLASKSVLTPADFAASGVDISYDPRKLELAIAIASERRAARNLQITQLNRAKLGDFVKPAKFSAYVNIRGSADYNYQGPNKGFASPVFFFDGAARAGNVVLESEAFWQPGASGNDFQRQGTRLVVDDTKNLMRWIAGDLQPITRSLQASPDMAGIGVLRSYSILQPQQITRPRGDRSFRLDRPSTVEVNVNGQIVQRLQLAPGTYNMRDFPFAQGSNDVKLAIRDDSGRTELLRFNLFLDQSQLAKGLTEFGAYVGVHAPLDRFGPNYTSDAVFTSFVRHGASDRLTLGANFQADKRVKMGGAEAVVASSIGTLALSFSLSDIKGHGSGWSSTSTFQRLIQRGNGKADSLTMSFEARSKKFGPLGSLAPQNQYAWDASAGYSHAFDDRSYAGLDMRYSKAFGLQSDQQSYRLTSGYRLSNRASLTADARYERDALGSRVSGLVSLNVRLGAFSNVRADYDTRDNRSRVSYNTIHGQGVGSYNISADLERSDRSAGASVNANYVHNRAELGLSHFGTFTDNFGRSVGQRSSLRFATSVAVADNLTSIGRPIYDSFAIVKGHRSLKGAPVVVEPTPFGQTASTKGLGTAVQPNLSSYAERTITVDAPTAEGGVDMGQGSYRVFPSYRSGYALTVGSDYSITAMGNMRNSDGEPVSLVTGVAKELAKPDKPGVTVFTNRDGRFGIAGLAPGKWRIEMLDDQKSVFDITIEEDAYGVVKLGEIKAVKGR